MSAAHQIKKAQEAELKALRQEDVLMNFLKGKKRTVNGVVYSTRKDAALARKAHLAEKKKRAATVERLAA